MCHVKADSSVLDVQPLLPAAVPAESTGTRAVRDGVAGSSATSRSPTTRVLVQGTSPAYSEAVRRKQHDAGALKLLAYNSSCCSAWLVRPTAQRVGRSTTLLPYQRCPSSK